MSILEILPVLSSLKNSIILSLNQAKIAFPRIEFDLIVVDYNSKKSDLDKINMQLKKSNFNNSVVSLNLEEFKNKIKKIT